MQMRLNLRVLRRDKWLYLMLAPGLLYFIIFKYLPMFGIVIAFQDYVPYVGIAGSKWVGFKHFDRFFHEPVFWVLMRNTLLLGLYQIVFYFPFPIMLALLLNEVRQALFRKFIQTVIYIPHFISWVVVVGISYMLLNAQDGIIMGLLHQAGWQPQDALGSPGWFRPLLTLQVIWKESGFGTIIFLAALAGVDPQLYEAAKMDGANRWQQVLHVSLPALRSTIVILLVFRLGTFLDTGFEQIFLMVNALNRSVGDVFDTYVYERGLTQGQFSYTAAVGLFKSVISLILVLLANRTAKAFGEEGVY